MGQKMVEKRNKDTQPHKNFVRNAPRDSGHSAAPSLLLKWPLNRSIFLSFDDATWLAGSAICFHSFPL